MEENKESPRINFPALAAATLGGFLVLGGAIFVAYRYSQKQSSDLIVPGGVTYLGATPTQTVSAPTPPPLRFTADPTVNWKTRRGVTYPYSFSYPETLQLVVFPGDKSDSVAISWNNIPPQVNILANIEMVSQRDPKYVSQPKINFVNDWYKFFSGLKGVSRVEQFTNANGLKGYRAVYINNLGQTPNTDIFFEVPGDKNLLIHLANGVLDPVIFDRIVDSLNWGTGTKITSPSP